MAETGIVKIDLEYVKFANNADPDANGTSLRVFLNGGEEKWLGVEGNFSEEKKVTYAETFEVKAGDVFIFAVDANGNDSYDGGRLSVKISDANGVDKAALASAITAAEALKEEDYTAESWAAFAEALDAAKTVNGKEDATQAEVDDALAALNAAKAALVKLNPEPARTNNTVLADDFSGEQGKNGWYYGACDWDGANFTELPYEAITITARSRN